MKKESRGVVPWLYTSEMMRAPMEADVHQVLPPCSALIGEEGHKTSIGWMTSSMWIGSVRNHSVLSFSANQRCCTQPTICDPSSSTARAGNPGKSECR